MQNPGSDAGVFVLGRRCAWPALRDEHDARCDVTLKTRNVTLRKKSSTLVGISQLCTPLREYTMVCVDNFKK
jgi:hypothetical protein